MPRDKILAKGKELLYASVISSYQQAARRNDNSWLFLAHLVLQMS